MRYCKLTLNKLIKDGLDLCYICLVDKYNYIDELYRY